LLFIIIIAPALLGILIFAVIAFVIYRVVKKARKKRTVAKPVSIQKEFDIEKIE
jgi:hypothetical protein